MYIIKLRLNFKYFIIHRCYIDTQHTLSNQNAKNWMRTYGNHKMIEQKKKNENQIFVITYCCCMPFFVSLFDCTMYIYNAHGLRFHSRSQY